MSRAEVVDNLYQHYVVSKKHGQNDYFSLIKEFVAKRNKHPSRSEEYLAWQTEIDKVYELVHDELISNQEQPKSPVAFGTSGWRGIIGKDIFVKSVFQVTEAVTGLYKELETSAELAAALGITSLEEARSRGAVVGHDNRFGGDLLAQSAIDVLTTNGFTVYYAGEASTGTLSAAVLVLNAAFSINLTPSHNPLEYAGFKYNAADGGPAAQIITERITKNVGRIMAANLPIQLKPDAGLIKQFDALQTWIDLVNKGSEQHGLNYDQIMADFFAADNCVVAIDCVHGASRVHIRSLFKNMEKKNLLLFRDNGDPTFGGVAPEPSTANMQAITSALRARPEKLKLGAIIDPDGDRIRLTDGTTEIDMNYFGAMAYHYLHEIKHKKGMVAKTVATSNFANAIAAAFQEEIFEPRVGFKEFKPVIGKALVYFEESDGISIIGHTPEKDAYIGLLLALDMILAMRKNLGEYLEEIKQAYGSYFPARGGITVSRHGEELKSTLALLDKYKAGAEVTVGNEQKRIKKVITIDGRKMIFEDDSWLMIRPSGTEPKVRFYVEARNETGKEALFKAAEEMLSEIGLV